MLVRLAALTALASVSLLAQPTYYKDVAPIVAAKCQQCHRDGDIAPFALKDYDSAVTWSADIQRVITNNIMPPWKPVAGYGTFRDALSLSDDQKQTLLDWIAAGTPAGDSSDLSVDANPPSGPWQLGQPDLVLQMAQPFTPNRGRDVYRCFVLPTGLDHKQYLNAIDILPGNRQIVHHVLLYTDTSGTALQLDGQDGQPGYDCFGGPGIPVTQAGGLGGWAPGQRAHALPDGIGLPVPANSVIVMQVHYYPAVTTGPDQTQIGLYYSKAQVQQNLYLVPVVNTSFTIQPGEVKDVKASFPAFVSAKAIWVYPHMHLIGRKIKLELDDLHGNLTPMIYEKDWDFNWQGSYTYQDPMQLPQGSVVRLTCTFDNTDANPKNPNSPLIPVSWGERTTDEMCLAFVAVTIDSEKLN